MKSNIFQFKQFSIQQNISAMKVGTDGVLLGAWANCQSAKKVLDIGTGTGLIAIMLAQRCNALIHAIEINKNAYTEAKVNANNCKWSNRISVQHISLQEFEKTCNAKYDLIVSNPPFFENSQPSTLAERNLARHTITLNCTELMLFANQHLTEQGLFSVIIPYSLLEEYTETAKQNNLFVKRQTNIKPTPTKNTKRVLLELSKQKIQYQPETIILEEFGRHQYSHEYKKLTSDFYISSYYNC